MTTISSFINRLKKIGIEVELSGNYPWIYMSKVNGYQVRQKYLGNHGFTVFWSGISDKITDIKKIFEQIRLIINYDKSIKTVNISNLIHYGSLYYSVWDDSKWMEENLATGEIKFFQKEEGNNIGELYTEVNEEYSFHWIHLGFGYYKQVSKVSFEEEEN